MSAPVDVLAVLAYHAHEMTKKFGPDNELAEACAAVAEFINEVRDVAVWMDVGPQRDRLFDALESVGDI